MDKWERIVYDRVKIHAGPEWKCEADELSRGRKQQTF